MIKLPSKDSSGFKLIDPGVHIGILYGIVDVGTQSFFYNGEEKPNRQIQFKFEFPENTDIFDGVEKPLSLTAYFNFFLRKNRQGVKPKLREFLENWGIKIKDGEEDSFVFEDILGRSGQVNIIEDKTKTGKDIRKIVSIAPLSKHILESQFKQLNKSFSYSVTEGENDVFNSFHDNLKDKIRQSKEWAASITPATQQNINEVFNNDGDLPF